MSVSKMLKRSVSLLGVGKLDYFFRPFTCEIARHCIKIKIEAIMPTPYRMALLSIVSPQSEFPQADESLPLHPTFRLKVGHLYPEHLNLYGDRGNLLALYHRGKRRGIDLDIVPIGFDESINPNVVDILFMGGGQDAQQLKIAHDLPLKADSIREAVSQGCVMLGICGGYQLMGHYYQPHEGDRITGLSLIDCYTEASHTRMIGNVAIRRQEGSTQKASTIVGFENHSGKTYLGSGVKPLGLVIKGYGNNGADQTEGVAEGTLYGTYLHGSLLPKNPQLADELLEKAFYRRYGDSTAFPELPDAASQDNLEEKAHKKALLISGAL
jgi:lipid II isoglutaminyl synthase (glutamine-hydrolysing)